MKEDMEGVQICRGYRNQGGTGNVALWTASVTTVNLTSAGGQTDRQTNFDKRNLKGESNPWPPLSLKRVSR